MGSDRGKSFCPVWLGSQPCLLWPRLSRPRSKQDAFAALSVLPSSGQHPDVTRAATLPDDAVNGLHAQRARYMRPVVALVVSIGGFFYGVSPLVLPVAARFAEGSVDGSDSIAGGIFLYGFAILFIGFDLTAVGWCIVLPGRPQLRRWVLNAAAVLWPAGVGLLAVAVHVASFPLFLFAFAFMSVPMGAICKYMMHVEVPLVWGDEITKGHAIVGLAIGSGALFWTLVLGELTHVLGAEHVATVIAAAAVISAIVHSAVLLRCSPGASLDYTTVDHNENAKTASGGKGATAHGSPRVTASCGQTGDSLHRRLSSSSAGQGSRRFGVLLRDWRVHVYTYSMNAFIFCGISMKMLLSTIFEEALGMSYVQATRLSAVCLLAYVPGRGLSPLLASKDRVFTLFLAVLAMEVLAYALTPWAVSQGGEEADTTGLAVYVMLRLVSGGGFAMMSGNVGVLAVRVFGAAEVPNVVAYWSIFEWLAGIGPGIAWVVHIESQAAGAGRGSFNAFFWLCACLAASSAIGITFLAWFPRPVLDSSSSAPHARVTASAEPCSQS